MSFLGIDIGEWAALIGIISAIISLIGFFMKKFVIEPLMEQISHLSDTIHDLSKNFNSRYEEHSEHLTKQDDRMDKMDIQFENHETRITNLEKGGTVHESNH